MTFYIVLKLYANVTSTDWYKDCNLWQEQSHCNTEQAHNLLQTGKRVSIRPDGKLQQQVVKTGHTALTYCGFPDHMSNFD